MKRKKELIVILSSLLVIVLSVSVAYFTTKILGTGKEISVESADLKVIFTSGSGTINGTNIEPGWTSGENTFTVKNESNGTYNYNIVIKDLVNTFTTSGFLVYKITSTDGGYNMTDFADVPKSSTAKDTVLANKISIGKDATHTYTVEFKYLESAEVDQSADMGKKLSGKIFIEDSTFKGGTLSEAMMYYNPVVSTRSDFSTYFSGSLNTIYKTTEKGKDVYYFAGDDSEKVPINNWVKFGKAQLGLCTFENHIVLVLPKQDGFLYRHAKSEEECVTGQICKLEENGLTAFFVDNTTEKCGSIGGTYVTGTASYTVEEKDLYWRIIRTNYDGSVKIIYSGEIFGMTDYNKGGNSSKYVGYMYGDTESTLDEARTNTNDSTVKAYIDNWYENNFTSYTNYLSNDAIYCNDRELSTGATYSAAPTEEFYFKAYERLSTNKAPTYECTNAKDAFSVNNVEAKLKYPMALLSADEAAYAGAVFEDNIGWLKGIKDDTFNDFLTMTPLNSGYKSSSDPYPYMPSVLEVENTFDGWLRQGTVEGDYDLRPATSLKSCVQWKSGDGTINNPFEIKMNGGC